MKRIFMVGVLVVAFAALPAIAGAANGDLKLQPRAGQLKAPDYDQQTGNSTAAQSQWTNKESETGKFSILLQKSVATADYAFAAVVVKGVAGDPVASLGTIGFSVKGQCTGGSPRFNLFWDNDGDGQYDGYGFYGCANHIVGPGAKAGWTRIEANSATPDVTVGAPPSPTATIVQLAVIADENGTSYVDNITAQGKTVGEPNGS